MGVGHSWKERFSPLRQRCAPIFSSRRRTSTGYHVACKTKIGEFGNSVVEFVMCSVSDGFTRFVCSVRASATKSTHGFQPKSSKTLRNEHMTNCARHVLTSNFQSISDEFWCGCHVCTSCGPVECGLRKAVCPGEGANAAILERFRYFVLERIFTQHKKGRRQSGPGAASTTSKELRKQLLVRKYSSTSSI